MKRTIRLLLLSICIMIVAYALVGCKSLVNWMDKVAEEASPQSQQQEAQQAAETKAPESLTAPTLRLSDGVLSWTRVDNAYQYCVTYTNTVTLEPKTIKTADVGLNLNTLDLPAGRYEIVVRAESNNPAYLDSGDSNKVKFTVSVDVSISVVSLSAYRVDQDSVLCVWSTAEGADVYHVTVDGTTVDSYTNFAVIPVNAGQDHQFVLTITGKTGYDRYDGQSKTVSYTGSLLDEVQVVGYDKKDEDLSFALYNAETVEWDGKALDQTFSGQLVLDATMLREQSVGLHYISVVTDLGVHSHALVRISDTRPLVFVNAAGVAIDRLEYRLTTGDLIVRMLVYQNTIRSVNYDAYTLTDSQYTIAADYISIPREIIQDIGDGTHTVRVDYTDSKGTSAYAELAVDIIIPTINTYDVHSGGDLVLNLPASASAIIGGGITSSDYTLGADTLTLKAAYLSTLSSGIYDYWIYVSSGLPFSLQVYNSAAAPHDVVLSYDYDDDDAYMCYQCNCGKSTHFYSLDGAGLKEINSFAVDIGVLDKAVKHTLTVFCPETSKTSFTYTIDPSSTAVNYMTYRYAFEGRSSDYYIGSVDEFCDVVRFLAYGGNIDYTKGSFGVSEMSVFIGNDVMSKSGDINDALNLLLDEARSRYTAPYNCSISASGSAFDSTLRTGALTISVTFSSAIAKPHVNGITSDGYADARTLLVANSTPRTTYLEGVSRLQPVGNVQELADLPLYVRPVFSSSDAATQLAQDTYNAALEVCKTYVRDSMTETQKLQVFYDYLSRFVTYDYYALVWYEIDERLSGLSYNQFAAWHNAAIATNQWNAFSDEERKDVNACSDYRAAAALVRRRAAETGAKAFWTNWKASFDTFESNAMTDTRNNARNQVTARGYTGTALDTDVQRLCAQSTFVGMVAVLDEITASSAFDAYGALCGKVAVCDGIADAFRLLCLVEGIECVKVSGVGTNSTGNSEAHAWNKVKVGGVWYCVDATWSKVSGCVTHRYFMVSDSRLKVNHTEQIDGVDAVETLALADNYNYYAGTVVDGYTLYVDTASAFSNTLKGLYRAGERTIELYVASCPSTADFEKALESAVKELTTPGGSISYSYTYSDGYAIVRF